MVAKTVERAREDAFRSYVADSLQLIPQGMYVGERWVERVGIARKDDRTAEEIVAHVIETAGLEVS